MQATAEREVGDVDEQPSGFHSLSEELDVTLDVDGRLPAWLDGALVRNGPGSFELGGASVDHWFDGLAMLRRFGFDEDTVEYRNRFLRTTAYEEAKDGSYRGGFGTDGSMSVLERLGAMVRPPSPTDNTNIDIWPHGPEPVATTETEHLTQFDPETLETTGRSSYLGEPYGQHVTGHPQFDAERAETVGVSTNFGRTSEYRIWRQPTHSWSREQIAAIPVERPAYLHSFALTERYVVVVEFPLVVSPLSLLLPSNKPFIERFEWAPERGTRYHIVERDTGVVHDPLVGEPCFCFHHVNAFEEGSELVLDMLTFTDSGPISELYFDASSEMGEMSMDAGRLSRATLTPETGAVEMETTHPGHLGLPRVSPDVTQEAYRFVYAQAQPGGTIEGLPTQLAKVDAETGEETLYDPGGVTSEPVFVPRPAGSAEDDGVVLAVALDRARGHSVLHVIDAETMTELATVTLPHALPLDFHGQYLPSA